MHITMAAYDGQKSEYLRLERYLEKTGWKASRITNDPVLGRGVKMYATGHLATTRLLAKKAVLAMAGELKQAGFKVLRAKVEDVVYDKLFGGNSVQ